MIPAETIEQVMVANDLVEIVSSQVNLRKCGATYTGLCPFHQEKTPSFVVTPMRRSFKCFGCGVRGSVFDFVMRRDGLGFLPALRLLADRAGIAVDGLDVSASKPRVCQPRPKLVIKRPEQPSFSPPTDLRQGTVKELRAVAEQRGLSLEGMTLVAERGLLWFGSPRGCLSWIVMDAQRVNAQARRMDGGLWNHIGGKKAYTLPGSRAAWSIGAREAAPFPFVVLVEGGPDLLAAHHFIVVESRESDVAAVGVLGACNDFPEDVLLLLANKRVRIFPHLDTAGRTAAVRWSEQLERVGCEVDAFSFDGLRRVDGGAVADLNDLALVDADSFEAERGELERIMPE